MIGSWGRRAAAAAALAAAMLVPAPGAGGAPRAEAPSVRLSIASRDQSEVLAQRRVSVRLAGRRAQRLRIRLLATTGRRTVRLTRAATTRARSTRVRLRLTKRGAALVRTDRSVCRATTISAYVTRGKRRLLKRVLKLRAPARCRPGRFPATASPSRGGSGGSAGDDGEGELGWPKTPAAYGIAKEANLKLTMRDGTQLLADVHRPTDLKTGKPAAGPFPVLLAITPYGKSSRTTTLYSADYGDGSLGKYGGDGYHPYLVERGYILAIVDARGTGSSDGSWDLMGPMEQQDGPEIARWAAKLPGSTGKVGLLGASYLGGNQFATAALGAADTPIKAMAPSIGAYDIYRDIFFPGGMFPAAFLNAYLLGLRAPLDLIPPGDYQQDPSRAIQAMVQHAGAVGTFYAPMAAQLNAGGPVRYDGAFWRARRVGDYIDKAVERNIPALVINAHFDLHQRAGMRQFSHFQNAWAGRPGDAPMRADQKVTPRYQAIIGPWYHLTAFQSLSYQQILLEWYDTWLKGRDTAFRRAKNPVHVFDLGTRKWVDAKTYPYAETDAETFWLDGGPSGSARSLNDGRLRQSPPGGEGSDALSWSPAVNPCGRMAEQWTMGLGALVAHVEGRDLRTINPCVADDRPAQTQALTYTTEPFKDAQTIAGPITATVFATATTSESQLVVTLQDVAPDGASYPLTSGGLIGSLRALDGERSWRQNGKLVLPYHPMTSASQTPVTPGKVERYDVEVFPTFATIKAGHRLRVTITPSADPLLSPVGDERAKLAGGRYAIQRGSVNASHVNVPLAPAARFRPASRSYGDCNASC